MSEVSMRQQPRSARKKNKEVFFSSPTTTPLRWVDFEEKIESVNRLYSVTTCEQKTKDCARSVSFQHKLQHRCFQLQCLPAFITSLPDCNSYLRCFLWPSVRISLRWTHSKGPKGVHPQGGEGGGTPNMKEVGILAVLFRGVNFGFWSHLGCSGQNAIVFSREGLV